MENASKALLIAGGVLIAILVASLGVYFSRSISEEVAKFYEKLEDNKRTEFNQQFLNFNDTFVMKEDGSWESTQINIQEVVTIINLAKNSNKQNDLEGITPPTNPQNDKSLYVTVKYIGPVGTIGVEALSDINKKNLETLTDGNIDEVITKEMSRQDGLRYFNCKVYVNSNTGYVNYIELK